MTRHTSRLSNGLLLAGAALIAFGAAPASAMGKMMGGKMMGGKMMHKPMMGMKMSDKMAMSKMMMGMSAHDRYTMSHMSMREKMLMMKVRKMCMMGKM